MSGQEFACYLKWVGLICFCALGLPVLPRGWCNACLNTLPICFDARRAVRQALSLKSPYTLTRGL